VPYGQRNAIVPLASCTPAYRSPSENNVSSACSCSLAKWCHCVYVMRCGVFGTNPKCHEDRNLILCLVHWVHSGHGKSSLWQEELGRLTNGKLPQSIRYGFFVPAALPHFTGLLFLLPSSPSSSSSLCLYLVISVVVVDIVAFFISFHRRSRCRCCCCCFLLIIFILSLASFLLTPFYVCILSSPL